MTLKFKAATRFALLLAAGAVAGLVAGVSAASAEQAKRRVMDTRYTSGSPNVSYQQGPHTRIYVSRRSWLDGGTEVLPGDRKFSDYAFPPQMGYPTFARENGNRPIDRQPLST
ncbi:MAG TPA: hypothetical protein VMM15_05195, partial [Bradyrhizobium sp.]|nr:hypothetical protein [Bradyrhizobium sp.]